jgi:hypothetical protein
MSNRYCHNCGHKQPKLDAKFCGECGTNLQSIASKPPQPEAPPQKQAPPPAWAEDDEREDIDNESHWVKIRSIRQSMANLEVEIQNPPQVQGEKLGTFVASAERDTSNYRNAITPELTKEQVAEQFAKEAGSRVQESRTHSVVVDEK